MAEANTAATKTKTAQPATSFGLPHYEIPKFDLPKMEMPEAFRELADKGVAQAKDDYERIRRAAEEMNVILEKTYSTTPRAWQTTTSSSSRWPAPTPMPLLNSPADLSP